MTAADVAARIAAMEAAEDAPEALRERVARAIGESWVEPLGWDELTRSTQNECRRLADAVLAVITTPVGADGGAE